MKLIPTQKNFLPPFLASAMSSGEHNGYVDDNDDPYNIREVKSGSHETTNINDYSSLVEELNWAVAPKLIISVVAAKTQERNLTESGANILTIRPHGRRCSEYYMGHNQVLDLA